MLNGSFSKSTEGDAQTIELISTDPYKAGKYTYDLSVTAF